jgi:hypothetical protein
LDWIFFTAFFVIPTTLLDELANYKYIHHYFFLEIIAMKLNATPFIIGVQAGGIILLLIRKSK